MMQIVSLCSDYQDASADMHIDLLRSNIDLMSNFDLDLSGSTNTCRDASRREKHDAAQIIVPTFFVHKLFTKTYVAIWGR